MDRYDVVTLAGLGLIGWGIGMMSVPWALIVVGTLLLVIGMAGAAARGKAAAYDSHIAAPDPAKSKEGG